MEKHKEDDSCGITLFSGKLPHLFDVPIQRRGPTRKVALSFAQQRLWFLEQMEGASEAYHIPLALRLAGQLDAAALRKALDRLVQRHEILRTSFVTVDGNPAQVISAENTTLALLETDLRKASEDLAAVIAAEASAPFDLQTSPLIRGRLIRTAEDEHILLLTMHHIISDGWSVGVLLRELGVLYNAFRENRPDPLPELAIQYADYALWQKEWVAGEVLQEQADYWKRALTGAPALLELPTDYPRPSQISYTGAVIGFSLGPDLTLKLRELSRRHRTTLFMTLLAAWSVLLARLSGQQEVVIGIPSANRGRIEIEGLIGFFVNTLALRMDLTQGPTVGEFLAQVRQQLVSAQQHQDIPFEQVVELLRPVRSPAHNPLLQVMLTWGTDRTSVELAGLELMPLQGAAQQTARFDLTLSLQDEGDQIVGGLNYVAVLFMPSTIERHLGYFKTLLEAMVADDTQRVDRLNVLPATERQQVLYEWNDTSVDYPSNRCIHELFEEQAAKTPEATAVIFEERQLSYAELNRQANRLARELLQHGVVPDARVGLCVERGLGMIVALLAVLKAGGAYVPLDPAYPEDRLQFMLEDAAPMVLITEKSLSGLFQNLAADLPVLYLEDEARWAKQPDDNLAPQVLGLTSHHLAYMIYTSGSTGLPKGVLVEHKGLCNLALAQASIPALNNRSRILQFASMSFDAFTFELTLALCHGGALCIPLNQPSLAVAELPWSVERFNVTHLTVPPAVLNSLPIDANLGVLQTLIVAGDIVDRTLHDRWKRSHQFVNAYGPTEGTIWTTHFDSSPSGTRSISIGRPIANTQVYLLDEHRQPVPIGVAGELYIGGAGVARGYLNRPELTEERFLADPFNGKPEARMYRTGDLARYLPDGNIEYLGRNDFQVKIRGFRIELGEIEAQLMQLPAVREAVVLAREDAPGDKRLVAYYTSNQDQVPVDTLRTRLAGVLPEYMVPAAFVRLHSLPLTLNGKLDRKALPPPELDAYAAAVFEPPQGEVETILAAIWSDLLHVEPIGRHDNFFELGGHSLLAINAAMQVRIQTDIECPPTALFSHPTLSGFAEYIIDVGFIQYDVDGFCRKEGLLGLNP